MNSRELLRLIPLFVVYLAALSLLGSHPDDEASYVDLAHRITAGTYVTGHADALLDPDPTPLVRAWTAGGARSACRDRSAVDRVALDRSGRPLRCCRPLLRARSSTLERVDGARRVLRIRALSALLAPAHQHP